MPLPPLEKTWQYDVNRALRSTGSDVGDHRRLLRQLKTSLVGFASNPWLVGYSCDGTTAGTPGDGVDRWLTDGSLVYGPGPHSWIVLRQPAVATGFQLLIALTGANLAVTVAISVAGFTGGNFFTRPSAVDEVVLSTNTRPHLFGTGTFDAILHVTQSVDGQCTRAVAHDATTGAPGMTVLIDRARTPATGWTAPFVVAWCGGSLIPAGGFTLDAVNAQPALRGLRGGEALRLYATCPTFGGLAAPRQIDVNDLSGERDLYVVGLASADFGTFGRHGALSDAWWGGQRIPLGETFPDSTARTAVKLTGDLVVPWNGTVPLIHL